MTPALLKLARYTEPPTCTVQTHGVKRQPVQNKRPFFVRVLSKKKKQTLAEKETKQLVNKSNRNITVTSKENGHKKTKIKDKHVI